MRKEPSQKSTRRLDCTTIQAKERSREKQGGSPVSGHGEKTEANSKQMKKNGAGSEKEYGTGSGEAYVQLGKSEGMGGFTEQQLLLARLFFGALSAAMVRKKISFLPILI